MFPFSPVFSPSLKSFSKQPAGWQVPIFIAVVSRLLAKRGLPLHDSVWCDFLSPLFYTWVRIFEGPERSLYLDL